MGVLKADRFPKLTDVPPEVRGESFVLKAENGEKLDLQIQEKGSQSHAAERPGANAAANAREKPEAPAPRAARRAPPRRRSTATRSGKRAK